jgi:methylenetetrahydrofolate reductase (NADPH)
MATVETPHAHRVATLLRRARYEVLPAEGIEELALAHVPRETVLTVTVSPTKGLEPTLDLTARLSAHGYGVVPHLAARLVVDRRHLEEVVSRLAGIGVTDVFVIAGDAPEPAGVYTGAAEMLEAMSELGHPFREIGIAGYPERHPLIDDETTIAAMSSKARFATYVVSQICFDPAVTAAWVEAVWARGTRLPIHVGIPGAVSRGKLLRISSRIGIGDSLRFLRKNTRLLSRVLSGGFDPDPLVDELAPALVDPEGKVAGLHVFTLNEVAETERWRRGRLARAQPQA